MVTVDRWTGVETRALRRAKRMSLQAFAAHLGVSERTLSTWERRGSTVNIRDVNQAALDTSLKVSSPDVHQRFAVLAWGVSIPEQAGSPESDNLPQQHRRHPTDGKEMARIGAGMFLSGQGNDSIWLPTYYIDVFPVTNAEYAAFVSATGHQPPDHWPKGKCPDALFDHPVTFVTWHDAIAYASWCGKQLPTAQQWEKAARGARGDVYPWGSQATPAKCNCRESRVGSTSPVDRYHSGVSEYGVYDLCGNAWEWCDSRTEMGRYELKGGAFTSPFARVTPSAFNDASSTMLDDDTGFRCVLLTDS